MSYRLSAAGVRVPRQVLRQLQGGEAVVTFDAETQSVTLALKRELPGDTR